MTDINRMGLTLYGTDGWCFVLADEINLVGRCKFSSFLFYVGGWLPVNRNLIKLNLNEKSTVTVS